MSKIKSFMKEWGTIITELVVCVSIIIGVVHVSRKYHIKDNGYKKAYKIRCGLVGDDKTTIYNGKYKIEDDMLYVKSKYNEYMFSVDSCYIQFKED